MLVDTDAIDNDSLGTNVTGTDGSTGTPRQPETRMLTHSPSRDASWFGQRLHHADLVDLHAVDVASWPASSEKPALGSASRWLALMDGDQYMNGLHHFKQHEENFVLCKVSCSCWQQRGLSLCMFMGGKVAAVTSPRSIQQNAASPSFTQPLSCKVGGASHA